jgi:hypothetical protein
MNQPLDMVSHRDENGTGKSHTVRSYEQIEYPLLGKNETGNFGKNSVEAERIRLNRFNDRFHGSHILAGTFRGIILYLGLLIPTTQQPSAQGSVVGAPLTPSAFLGRTATATNPAS